VAVCRLSLQLVATIRTSADNTKAVIAHALLITHHVASASAFASTLAPAQIRSQQMGRENWKPNESITRGEGGGLGGLLDKHHDDANTAQYDSG
jgi:hypothetical protein